MAKNTYQQRDEIAQGMVDTAVRRLANPGGVKSHGYSDSSKPPLDYGAVPSLKIKPVRDSVKKLNINGTAKK